MLADQSITIDGVTVSLPRTSSALDLGVFSSNDGLIKEKVSHTAGKRVRHLFRLDHNKVAPDPFQTAVNAKYGMSAYLVIDVPPVGYTVADQKKVVDGLLAQITASSGALITKILGGES